MVKKERNLSVDYGALLLRSDSGLPAVLQGSPAQKAGLLEGDIILEFGGERISTQNPLSEFILKHRVGESVKLKVLRQDKEVTVEIVLTQRPEE